MTYETNRLKEEILGDAKYVYSYDDRGNITAIQEKIKAIVAEEEVIRMEETHSYVYDDKNQLIRENDLSQDKTIVYNYDKGGNLLSRKEYAYTTAETIDETTLENTIEYTYSSQWKDQLAEFNGSEIKYDAIGNPTEYLGKNLTWNGRRLSSYTQNGITTTYTYNADGLRSTKAVGNETTEYYYVGDLLSYEKRGDKELFYTYDFSGNVVRIRYFHDNEDETYYPAVNSRGDVEALYNEDGTVAVRYSYDTWGNILGIKDGNGQEIEEATHIGLVNPIRYRGYYYDAESGFYYLKSRYYDPEVGRFISADGQVSGIGGNIRGYNLYSYCMNNPVNMFDPMGNWPRWISYTVAAVATLFAAVTAAPAAIAVAIGATVTYGTQVWHYDVRKSKNKNLPKTPKQANDAKWKNSNPKTSSNPNGGGPAASCHQYTSKNKTNVKYVSPDEKREVIFYSVGNVVNDPRDIGTYNFKPSSGAWYSKESISHCVADILPWIFLGNSDEDWGPVINFFIN